MSEEQNDNQFSPEEIEAIYARQRPLAFRIAKEAVRLANIPQLPPNDDEFTNQRWRISYREENKDIALTIQLNPIVTKAITHISLGLVAWGILREMETLLSNPKAMEKLMVEESEREAEIFNKTLRLTQDYINYLPLVIYHSFHQALNETMVSHIKKFVDYDMRKYLDNIGKPNKKFTLLPNNNLNDITKLFPDTEFELLQSLGMINEEFSVYRKGAFGDRQVWLTPEAFANLPSDYEQLRIEYKEAKCEYKLEYKAFRRVNRRSTFEEDWKKHWEELSDEKFQNIFFSEELPNYSASELAYRQLGDKFGISASYMETLVGNARQQAEGKARSNKKTDKKM